MDLKPGQIVIVSYTNREATVKSVSETTVVVLNHLGKTLYLKHKDVRKP